MDPVSFYGLAGVPVVLALVQLFKVTFPTLAAHFWPAIALGVAVVFNLGLAALMGAPLPGAILVGLVTGLSASGLYSYAKTGG